jgi:hypothetical protein
MGTVRSGIYLPLESLANEMIFGSLKGVTSQSAKSDVLTEWKEVDRRRREVLTSEGFPEAQTRRGMFKRAANKTKPYLNSREGIARGTRMLGTTSGTQYSTGGGGEHDE